MADFGPLLADQGYEISATISQGTHTSVFVAKDKATGEEVELIKRSQHHELDHEVRHYNLLTGGIGIPFVHWTSKHGLVALTMLGPSLQELFGVCKSHLSLKTILLIADQVIPCLELVHKRSLFHGDVRPENFRIGTGKCGNLIYATGFASSTKGPSQRQDMEYLGRMLLYFRGGLPWLEVAAASIEDLCRDLPDAFSDYFQHLNSLGSEIKPDYSYLRRIFQDLYNSNKFQQDFVFDWTLRKYQLKSSGTAATINTGGNDAGEPFVEQSDYRPISQKELQTEVANIFTSVTNLQDTEDADKRLASEKLLDEGFDLFSANNFLTPENRQSNQEITSIIWANIRKYLWDKNHESNQKLAFLRSAYSKLTAIYITVPASQSIWVKYLHELSKRGAEIDNDNDRCKAWDITSQEWAKAGGA